MKNNKKNFAQFSNVAENNKMDKEKNQNTIL